MANVNKAYYAAKGALSYVWYRYNRIQNVPEADLAVKTAISGIHRLRDLIWVEMFYAWGDWQDFLKKHENRMISSPKAYATYVTYACLLLNDQYWSGFDCFVLTLAIVAAFAVFVRKRSQAEFVDVSSEIFAAFFEDHLKEKFAKEGTWKSFSKVYSDRSSLDDLKTVNEMYKLEEISEIVNVLSMDREISGKMGKKVLKDIKQEVVETDKRTLSLVEKISDKIEKICREAKQEAEKDSTPEADSKADIPRTAQPVTSVGRCALIEEAKIKLKEAVNDIMHITGVLEYIYPQLAEALDK
ncbi:hypothetical protein TNIN_31881 [Trichonephila inaurata madagascariensis]|uniref:Uncharacterized protein n=1 Tax=Trichonephila inaurata madagascariensis TaxID=2747483 RepID=A0A8X6MDZ9_9ARAC|nr:hypothetical protein TNIN_31881 [Trichonephila inaurata madagascariensis]